MNNTNATQELSYYEKNKKRITARRAANRELLRIKANEFYARNKEKVKAKNKQYRLSNLEKVREYFKTNKEVLKEQRQKHYIENRDRILARRRKLIKHRLNNDPLFKIAHTLRCRVLDALKGRYKSAPTLELLGCSIEEAKKHIETQWLPGMTWDNHSLHGWHIDHIIPIDTFDLADYKQQKVCFHYSNLRPLWATDNLSRPKDGSDIVVDNLVLK